MFEFKSLHSPVNKSGWIDHANAAVVNAFYTFSENSISKCFIILNFLKNTKNLKVFENMPKIFLDLPAGILQGAFFSSDRPRYMNYGAIGTVIGHEIIHGYDDKGRQYDKNGNLVDWWLPTTEKSFLERSQCFIKQYSNYRYNEVDMNVRISY